MNHMYLDTIGMVTIGVGYILPDVEHALKLRFVKRGTSEEANEQDVREEFERISAQKAGRLANTYGAFTQLEIDESEKNRLLDERIEQFLLGLRREFNEFEDYPESVRLALIDMVFSLGNHGLRMKFPTFVRAVKLRDWEAAAQASNRRGISDIRNEETKKLFREAADQDFH